MKRIVETLNGRVLVQLLKADLKAELLVTVEHDEGKSLSILLQVPATKEFWKVVDELKAEAGKHK